jgi:tetratricopeptide (TPR) repeat protein
LAACWLIGTILVVCCCSLRGNGVKIDYETEFLQGLRSRGLYRLAVGHAESILADSETSDTAKIELAMELSRTLAEWGSASPPPEQEERWQRAHAVLRETLARLESHPRSLLLSLQDALLWLAEGELAKEEAVITGSEASTSVAREKLRTTISILEGLSDQVEQAARGERMARPSTGGSEQGLSASELTSLGYHIVLQTAEALQRQAETYPAGSPDRVNSLTRSIDQLTSLMRQVGENELRHQAELDRVACHRLLGHLDEAERLLPASTSDPGLAAPLAAEQVRLLLAAGRVAAALETAEDHRQQAANASPEVLLAHLEALAAHVASRTDPAEPTQAIDTATRILAELESTHGPRWHRRGELWVSRMLALTNHQAKSAQTARLAAEGLYRAGRLAESVTAFDRAAALAREQEDLETSFDLALTAAAIVRERDDAPEAARRYLELARANAMHVRAAEAHRLGILSTAAAARSATSSAKQSEFLATYSGLLQEHLTKWADAPTSDEVRVWLGRWSLQQRDAAGASRVLAEVDPASAHYGDSRRLMAEIYEHRLSTLVEPSDRAALANEAAHSLQPIITGNDNAWPAEWTALQRDIALALAKLQLLYAEDGAAYAERLLTAALSASDGQADSWRGQAAGLLLVADTLLGRSDRTEGLLNELGSATAETRAEVVRYLTEPRPDVASAHLHELSRLALRLLDGLAATDATSLASVAGPLARFRARALAGVGQRDEAVALYKDLVTSHPKDAEFHEEYAALLAAGDTADDHRAGLQVYQQIEARSKPGGDRWMQARLARIRLFVRLGDRTQAQRLLKLTATMHPKLGDPTTHREFDAMARELGE